VVVGADSITDTFNTLCHFLTMSLFCVKSHGKQIFCVCVYVCACMHISTHSFNAVLVV